MFGPIYSELAKVNKRKAEIEFNNKVEEIVKLYLKANVPVPVKVQLENTKEVIEACSRLNLNIPPIAKRKSKLLKKIELFKSISVLTIFTFLIIGLIKFEEKYQTTVLLISSLLLITNGIIAIGYISKYFESNFDKKVDDTLTR